ncbi:ATP-binding cassette domain-containing protein [Bifidobacterium sp. 64T4]|uniref:ABC transporter ATP-binding protein n=1 Tax=Bifidobacterium pongonis TaxID=2834432 RepID=UPI001C582896|nr:ATP-binding cassette domain-containing protein [Bifidobacterium pongonis]MBW3094750.1 ATP-binding cassette domain-containing protein [Bifidobacterium pongonis]
MRYVFRASDMRCEVPDSDSSRTIFAGLSFSIGAGEIVDLVGPSGSGKSSLLTAFAQLNPYASGSLELDGRASGEFTPQQWRGLVAYLPQKPVLTGATVAEAIRLPWTLRIRAGAEGGVLPWLRRACSRQSPDMRAKALLPDGRIREMLDGIGCEDIELDRAPHDLSGGQAARVSLARTLLTEPKVMLADEVDAGLDDGNADKVASIMAEAASHGMAIVRIRHRPPDGRASRIATLDGGTLTETLAERQEGLA